MSKRMLFIIPLASSYKLFLKELGDKMLMEGYEIYVLTCNSQNIRIENVKIISIDIPRSINPIKHFRCAFKIKQVVKRIKPHIIHVHFSSTIFTVALAKNSQWPFTIATFHGVSFPVFPFGLKRKLILMAEVYAASKMDEVWVLTNDDYQALNQYIDSPKLHCYKSLGVGCDITRFNKANYSTTDIDNIRETLHILRDDIVLIYVGRYVHFKGFDLAIRAFLSLQDNQYKLLLLGEKDPIHSTGLTVTEEKQLLQNPNVRRIGQVKNVEDYLAISDIMVFPSRREGMPVCVMEALSMGIPCIVANSRGCNKLIRQDNGYVLKDISLKSIREAILQLSKNRMKMYRGETIRKDRLRYDRTIYIDEQMDIYNHLINRISL